MTFNLSLFLHEVLYTAYLLASWLCLTWLIRFVELVCCALFSSFCFELYNSFNTEDVIISKFLNYWSIVFRLFLFKP